MIGENIYKQNRRVETEEQRINQNAQSRCNHHILMLNIIINIIIINITHTTSKVEQSIRNDERWEGS